MRVRTPLKRRPPPLRRLHSPLFYHSDEHPDLANFVRSAHELLKNKMQNRPRHEENVFNLLQKLQPFDEDNKKESDMLCYLRSLVVCVLKAQNPSLNNEAVQILNQLCTNTKWRESCQAQEGFVPGLCNLCHKSKKESDLNLLSYVTIDYKLNCPISEIKTFVLHLVATIRDADVSSDKDNNMEVVQGLRILSNLVHRNLELKLVVTEYADYNALLKKLVKFIRHAHGCIDALQFLVFLVLNTEREKEFFREKNLHSTMSIVFGKLSSKREGPEVVKKCIVILTKLLNDSTDIMTSLESFSELEASLCKIIELSFINDEQMRCLSLELLFVLLGSQQCQKILIHIFSSKPELSRKLLEDIFSANSLDMQIICRRLLKKILQSRHSGLERSVKSEHQFALELLGNTDFINRLVRCLCNQIHTTTQGITHSFGAAKTSKNQTAIRELVELIGVLCHRKEFRRKLAGSLQIEDVESLLSRDTLCKYTSLTFPLINLLFQIRKEMKAVNDRFLVLVEDVHVLKQCGRCLSSKNQFEVREAILFLRQCFSHINEGKVKQLDMLDGIAKEIHASNKEIKEDRETLALRENEASARVQKYQKLYSRVLDQRNKEKADFKLKYAQLEKQLSAKEKQWAKEKEAMRKEHEEQEKSNNDQIDTLKTENQSLDEQRKCLSQDVKIKKNELRDMELTIKDLKHQIRYKTDKMEEIITKKNEEKQLADKLQMKNFQLTKEKEDAEKLLDEYKKKIVALARHYQKLQNDNTQIKEEKRNVERKLTASASSNKKLEKEKKELKHGVEMKKAEINKLKQQVDEQKKDIKDLEDDCNDLEQEKSRLEMTLQVMMEAAQKSKKEGGEGRRRKRRKRNQEGT